MFPFENASSDRNLDWIGEGIAELINERLQSEVFTRDERLAAFEKLGIPSEAAVSRATAVRLGWDAGADFVITGRYSGTPENFEVSARVIDLASSRSGREFKVTVKLEEFVRTRAKALDYMLGGQLQGNAAAVGAVRGAQARQREASSDDRPRSPAAFENYIRGLLSNDPEKRAEYFQTAIRLEPQFPAAIFQLGRSYHEERDFKNSNLWLEKITDADPEYLQARFTMALNRFYFGDFTGAISIFEKLPATYDVLINLGAAHSHKGNHAAALMAWSKAAELDPLSSEAFFNSGYVGFLQSRNDAALRDLRESLRLRGRDSEALFLLAKTYERLGHMEDSHRTMAQATRLSQRVERWMSGANASPIGRSHQGMSGANASPIGRSHQGLTQPMPKLERLRTSTSFRNSKEIWTEERLNRRAQSQDLTAWLEAIQTYIDAYQYGEAIRELQDVIRMYPGSTEARSLLEEVNARRNRQ
ncbi:MAG: hypothetical protein HY646_21295 [Acidobacteria bacterium]|nr:hypothetical protein [Acidobacteriota bacterium]